MKKIINQKHTKDTVFYSISRMLERASYYGFRSLFILYMISETMSMSRMDALNVYGWFAGSIVFSKIIGALIGDLLIGNRKAIIFGGLIQALGAFSLCIPSITGLYIGLTLIVLGNGFYSPNLIANYGKLYLNKTELLDAGFTILFLSANIGAFAGTLLVGRIGETFDWKYGFISSGILMLLSILFLNMAENKESIETIKKGTLIFRKRIIYISSILFSVTLFWLIYEIAAVRLHEIRMEFVFNSIIDIPESDWKIFDTIFVTIFSILLVFLWSKYHYNRFYKLTIGFIFAFISFAILFFVDDILSNQDFVLYLLSLMFFGIAEVHIAPLLYSALTKYSNPKYLAIFISLAFIPRYLFSMSFLVIDDRFYNDTSFSLKFGVIVFLIISIGLIATLLIKEYRKTTYNTS